MSTRNNIALAGLTASVGSLTNVATKHERELQFLRRKIAAIHVENANMLRSIEKLERTLATCLQSQRSGSCVSQPS